MTAATHLHLTQSQIISLAQLEGQLRQKEHVSMCAVHRLTCSRWQQNENQHTALLSRRALQTAQEQISQVVVQMYFQEQTQ